MTFKKIDIGTLLHFLLTWKEGMEEILSHTEPYKFIAHNFINKNECHLCVCVYARMRTHVI